MQRHPASHHSAPSALYENAVELYDYAMKVEPLVILATIVGGIVFLSAGKALFATRTLWKNKKGTGKRSCECGSWKQHWLNLSGKSWPLKCSVEKCSSPPEVGGHIIQVGQSQEQVVPLCHSCNSRDDTFYLGMGVTPVGANKAKTCKNNKSKVRIYQVKPRAALTTGK